MKSLSGWGLIEPSGENSTVDRPAVKTIPRRPRAGDAPGPPQRRAGLFLDSDEVVDLLGILAK
jgi:hypothetical protein